MQLNQNPIYNLKAVIKETGIAADTLRAWERRYGLPKPGRTPGGHRLYSQHDIPLIKWLMKRQAEGLSISRAVDHWNEAIAAGADPLAGTQFIVQSGALTEPVLTSNLDALREEWLADCLDYNEAAAERILNQAFSYYSVEIVVIDLIQRGLHEVGERWKSGQVSVQQEHFVSIMAMQRLDGLIGSSPAPVHSHRLVLAGPPGELHSLPLQQLAFLLRRRSWPVVFLGADVPLAHLDETVEVVKPDLVVMAAQQLTTASALNECVTLLNKKGVRAAFGGMVFNQIPALQYKLSAEFLGPEMRPAVDRIEQLLQEQGHVVLDIEPPQNPLLQTFRASRPQIELTILQAFSRMKLPGAYLGVANEYFGAALEAALDLGNVAYLEADLAWIGSLLAGRGLPAASLPDYLTAYAKAFHHVMGTSAKETAEWIEAYAGKIRH